MRSSCAESLPGNIEVPPPGVSWQHCRTACRRGVGGGSDEAAKRLRGGVADRGKPSVRRPGLPGRTAEPSTGSAFRIDLWMMRSVRRKLRVGMPCPAMAGMRPCRAPRPPQSVTCGRSCDDMAAVTGTRPDRWPRGVRRGGESRLARAGNKAGRWLRPPSPREVRGRRSRVGALRLRHVVVVAGRKSFVYVVLRQLLAPPAGGRRHKALCSSRLPTCRAIGGMADQVVLTLLCVV